MKIYILSDMEGISGIRKLEDVKKEYPAEYSYGRQLMMKDINAAVEGCIRGGATEIVVADTHGGGGQIYIDQMDERALYETPCKGLMMPSLDETFDGVILLGHHAKAGTLNGFLDHTMSSLSWFDYTINGKSVGEIGIEAAWAGHFNVPVIMISGDDKTALEGKELLGTVETAVVKWGIGRNRAKCLPTSKAHTLITDTAEKAVAAVKNYKPYKPSLPCRITLTFYRSDYADQYENMTGFKRIDGRTIEKTVDSLFDIRIC